MILIYPGNIWQYVVLISQEDGVAEPPVAQSSLTSSRSGVSQLVILILGFQYGGASFTSRNWSKSWKTTNLSMSHLFRIVFNVRLSKGHNQVSPSSQPAFHIQGWPYLQTWTVMDLQSIPMVSLKLDVRKGPTAQLWRTRMIQPLKWAVSQQDNRLMLGWWFYQAFFVNDQNPL